MYAYSNESLATLPEQIQRNPNIPRIPLHPRDSFDSVVSSTSNSYFPRRVESIMGEEDRRKYYTAQSNQPLAGGAYMTQTQGRENPYFPPSDIYDDAKPGFITDSTESLNSSLARSPISRNSSIQPTPIHSPVPVSPPLLVIPPPAAHLGEGPGRRSPLQRSAPSPLGQVSRIAGDEETDTQLESSTTAVATSSEEGSSDSGKDKKPNKLKKHPRGG